MSTITSQTTNRYFQSKAKAGFNALTLEKNTEFRTDVNAYRLRARAAGSASPVSVVSMAKEIKQEKNGNS